MYVCMYVCMYACMHVCMYVWVLASLLVLAVLGLDLELVLSWGVGLPWLLLESSSVESLMA